jgi:hypothetical protein
MITDNIDVANGIANGTQATLQSVMLKNTTHLNYITLDNNIKVRAIFASDIDYIECKHSNTNVAQQIFRIQPKLISFQAKLPLPQHLKHTNNVNQIYSMHANQIPIKINNATSGHKLQGSSINKLFIHSWHYQKNWPYVILSKVKSFEGLFLRKQLDSNLKRYKIPNELTHMINELKNLSPNQLDYSYFRYDQIFENRKNHFRFLANNLSDWGKIDKNDC